MKRVAVFAKPPVPGRVKTRLSPALPAELACALYRAMLDDAIAAARSCRADETLLYWADDPESSGARTPDGVLDRRQRGEDLGARLAAGFSELLGGPDDAAVVIGGDCPALDAGVIDHAFRELERHDLVIGPTRDGGYYLIGLRRSNEKLFEGVSWSTERVLGETLERAQRLGLETVLLGLLDDLDTVEDLTHVLVDATTGAQVGRSTAGALRTVGLLPPE